MTEDGDEVTVSPRPGPENTEAILGIVVGNTLNETGHNFPC